MSKTIEIGSHVAWQWGQGVAEGVVKEVRHEPTTVTSKGKTIRRNGSQDDPALIIAAKNGAKVLKLAHEVQMTHAD